MSILVAGGSGFIGFHLVKRLVELGNRVVIFDSQPPPFLPDNLPGKATWVKGDATRLVDVLHALREHEVRDIYHLVALLANVCQEKPHLAMKINVETLLNFLEAARLFKLGRIVFASSVAVYGPNEPAPVSEEAPTNPASVYGATKVLGEFYGLHYCRSFGVDFRALRFTTLYGLGKSGGSTGICSLMIEKAARGEAVSGDVRDAVTDWLYVKDAVNSLLLAREIENPKTRIYNIGGGSHSVGEVSGIVKKCLPAARINLEAERTFPWPPSYCWDRAEEEMGFIPIFDIEKGVKDFIEEAQNPRSEN